MSTQRRKFELDPDAACPCPPPAWVSTVVDHAAGLGLHPTQRDAIQAVLGSAELDSAPIPAIESYGRGPAASVVLAWRGEQHCMQLHIFRAVGGWRTRLGLWRDGERTVDEQPVHPGDVLRGMLATVFPGVCRSDRGRGT
jgi:hypothetical protein